MKQDVRCQKLDADLSELLQSLARTEKVPVVLTSRADRLDDLVSLIRENEGGIRHVLTKLGAVSAWLNGDAVARLSRSDIVDELELAQPTSPAR